MKLNRRLLVLFILLISIFCFTSIINAEENAHENEERDDKRSEMIEAGDAHIGDLEQIEGSSYQDGEESDTLEVGQTREYFKADDEAARDTGKLENMRHADKTKVKQLKETSIQSDKVTQNSGLNPGERSQEVQDMKKKLMTIGFGTHWRNPTTYYGPDTEKVVLEFQAYYSLPVTGIMDDSSLAKLEEVLSSPYQRGNRSKAIQNLKLDLVFLGFANWKNPTTYYGPETENVVKAFQDKNNLVVNGIIDEVTLNKIESLKNQPLQRGLRRADVIDLKNKLMKVGFGTHWKNPTNYYGPDTEKVVREFQAYYGLSVDGVMGEASLAKLDEIVSSPYQYGKRSEAIKKIKLDLVFLGFANWENPTTYYGPETRNVVKAFQEKNSLVVNGIIDEITLNKIESLKNQPLQRGLRRADVIDLKNKLMKAGFGTHWRNPTNFYGPDTEKVVREFQAYYGLSVDGIMGDVSLAKLEEVLSSPYQRNNRSQEIKNLKNDLVKLGFAYWENPSTLYGPETENVVKEFQTHYELVVNGIIDEVTLDKINHLLSQAMQRGDRSDEVLAFKQKLMRLGFGTHWENPTNFYGPDTEKVVREFQKFYGLAVSGVANEFTLNKMNEILSSPMQRGESSKEILDMKEKLVTLGFATWNPPTNYYGPDTERVVREFQEAFGLPVSGIADAKTLAKIEEILRERIVTTYSYYDITLEEALNIQMTSSPQTDKYRNDPAYISATYVNIDRVRITGSSVNLRRTPDFKHSPVRSVGLGTTLTFLGEVTGANHQGSTKWYEVRYNNQKLYVHSSLATLLGTVTGNNVNVRSGQGTSYHIFGKLKKDTTVTIINRGSKWHRISYSTWRNATRSDVRPYLDPNKNDKYQHLLLSGTAGLEAKDLRSLLSGKGTLNGTESIFINASRKYNVNEAYLVAHALLESGNGTSTLAKGVEVGKDRNGNIVLVTNSNRKNLTDIKKVYNMFGIAAVDSNPVRGGARKAYEEGWTSVKKAIEGGAKWISENYVNHPSYQQNTLYKMRWNPNSPGTHQYATDIGWAVKQTSRIKTVYDKLPNAILHFDIPVYK